MTTTKNQNNSFSNILINILIPVFILNKGAKLHLTPQNAVLLALSFPLFYGLYSLIKEKKINFISLLGLINIIASGTLTLLALGGIWFALKEAIFPLLIGIFVYVSSYGSTPFFETLFLNPAAFQVEKIQKIISEKNAQNEFKELIIHSTRWLSMSFLMSALLNFVLAVYIFTPIDESLKIEVRQELLNQQLSQMTLYSFIVILAPSIVFLGGILYFAFNKLKKMTGLNTDELFVTQ